MARPMRRGAAAPRRQRVWARNVFTLPGISAAAPQFADLLAPYVTTREAQVQGATVGRVRLDLALTQTSGSENPPSCIVGLQVVKDSMEAVDHPPADLIDGYAHENWMWWRKLYVPRDGVPALLFQSHYEVDVKAMRKLERHTERLRLVAQSPTGSANGFSLSVGSSVLLLLP